MEASEAPSSSDPAPEPQTAKLPSETPPTISTPTSSSQTLSQSQSQSQSQTQSQSQSQSQSSHLQRQPVAARTRSHTQLQSPSSSSVPASASSGTRNGIAIGVPAIPPHQSRPPSSAGYSYGPSPRYSQPFMSSSSPSFSQPSSSSQFKPPAPNVQTIGMIGSLSSAPRMRVSGIHHQQRLGQPIDKSLPQLATNQTLNTQKFPNPGLVRPTSVPPPNAPISTPQSAQSLQQQWMSNQGKQTPGTSFPSSSYGPLTPNQLLVSSSQQQKQLQLQLQQHNHLQQQNISMPHHLQDLHSNRNQQSLPQQHQLAPKGHASITQRLNNHLGQPVLGHSGSAIPITEDTPETGNQILSKGSIQELVAQIDPYEKLEPEVEDVLMEIANDFVESITTSACLLAKHRKSTALEAKDILLYVERNWNMTLPGFSGDDIKCYKKPYTTDIHKKRLAMIRKSMGMASEVGSTKNVAVGQVATNSKGQASKPSVPAFTSPKVA